MQPARSNDARVNTDIARSLLPNHALRRVFFEETPVPACIINSGGRIADCNLAFARALEYGQDEISGAHYTRITQPGESELALPGHLIPDTPCTDGTDFMSPRSFAHRLVTKTGRVEWWHAQEHRVCHNGGWLSICYLVKMDVPSSPESWQRPVEKDKSAPAFKAPMRAARYFLAYARENPVELAFMTIGLFLLAGKDNALMMIKHLLKLLTMTA